MKRYRTKFKSFQRKVVQMGRLQKLQDSIHTLINLFCGLSSTSLLNILTLWSSLGDIWRAPILPFSSPKYFYSFWRLSNLVDLSFEYLSQFQTNGKPYSFPVLHVSTMAYCLFSNRKGLGTRLLIMAYNLVPRAFPSTIFKMADRREKTSG